VQAGVFLTVVDMTSAYIAVPSIATEFGIGLPAAQWFLAGYLLTLATLLVPAGRLSDNFGRKNLFVGGFSLGAIGAFAAYFATGIEMLITARVVMGIGAATVQASSMPIINT
jgi:MFS family permease